MRHDEIMQTHAELDEIEKGIDRCREELYRMEERRRNVATESKRKQQPTPMMIYTIGVASFVTLALVMWAAA